jgi:hypothetical protein
MQQFLFKFRHISGPLNGVTDWQSRFASIMDEDLISSFEEELSNTDSEQLWDVLSSFDELSARDTPQLLLGISTVNVLTDNPLCQKTSSSTAVEITRDIMLREAHCKRGGYNGVFRTHRILNDNFPNHGIFQAQVTSFKEQCDISHTPLSSCWAFPPRTF